jgi:hypothetical protein
MAAIGGHSRKDLETQIRSDVREAADLFEDALRCAPSWVLKHKFTVVDPESKVGKKVEKELREMRQRLQPRRHEAILGPVGRFLGRLFAKLATWFDPAAC